VICCFVVGYHTKHRLVVKQTVWFVVLLLAITLSTDVLLSKQCDLLFCCWLSH